MTKTGFYLFMVLLASACTAKVAPYQCGPVMTKKSIRQVFQLILSYMDLKSGEVLADVGASSGCFNAMMATLTDSVTYYIQDIDTACLNEKEFDKILNYYTKQSKKSLKETNKYHIVIGGLEQTNLPDNTIDKIYTNGTFHAFSNPESIMKDLYKKLKTNGLIFIREEINFGKEVKHCQDEKCGKQLASYEKLIEVMEKSGFKLVEKSKEFSGHPIYQFVKVN
jgi:precorrin-6B methylase 2